MLEVVNAVNLDISIHAPREGGDYTSFACHE